MSTTVTETSTTATSTTVTSTGTTATSSTTTGASTTATATSTYNCNCVEDSTVPMETCIAIGMCHLYLQVVSELIEYNIVMPKLQNFVRKYWFYFCNEYATNETRTEKSFVLLFTLQ